MRRSTDHFRRSRETSPDVFNQVYQTTTSSPARQTVHSQCRQRQFTSGHLDSRLEYQLNQKANDDGCTTHVFNMPAVCRQFDTQQSTTLFQRQAKDRRNLKSFALKQKRNFAMYQSMTENYEGKTLLKKEIAGKQTISINSRNGEIVDIKEQGSSRSSTQT